MRPKQEELDVEIRGHLALATKERIERGEDPAAARLAALKEFGNVTLTRDSMQGVWRRRGLRARTRRGKLPRQRAAVGTSPGAWGGGGVDWCGGRRVVHARRTGLARGRHARAPIGIGPGVE